VVQATLPAARRAVQRARADDPIGDHPYLSAPELVRVLAPSGRFDEATTAAQAFTVADHDAQARSTDRPAGRPTAEVAV